MPILNTKPHYLFRLVKLKGYEDQNGDFHPGEEQWEYYGRCDVVPAGQAGTISLPDGVEVRYSYTIYLPKKTKEFSVGDKVRISFFGKGATDEKREFTVKGFHSYQHQCKLWV